MLHQERWKSKIKSAEDGFALVEILVAIAILAILMVTAVLTIPNHDDRYWRDNLDQLVGSLNMAQEESTLSDTVMLAQIDSQGLRFVSVAGSPSNTPVNALISIGGQPVFAGASGLMPDVYRSQAWHKPVVIDPVQLTLGGEVITTALKIPIAQEQRRAILIRSANGRFSWVNGDAQ